MSHDIGGISTNVQIAAAKTTLAGALALEIQERRAAGLRGKNVPYPRSVSILSDIGECDRQMVYSITNWQDKPPFKDDLLYRFEAGKDQELLLVRDLNGLGYEVIGAQETIEIKNRERETVGRGKIDGKINYHGIKIPFEIKSMNPMVFDNIDTIEDFEKKPYLRKYIRQLTMYLYGNNVEEGLLICTDCLGHWKFFVVTLDFGLAEQIVQRLERVHAHIKAKTQPDRIEFRDEICGKCPFYQICLPDFIRTEVEVLNDEDFLMDLQIREDNKQPHADYEAADKKAKKFIKKYGITKGIAGDFLITSKTTPKAERAAIPAGTQTRIEISRLEEIRKVA